MQRERSLVENVFCFLPPIPEHRNFVKPLILSAHLIPLTPKEVLRRVCGRKT